jgi:hypothetical protein
MKTFYAELTIESNIEYVPGFGDIDTSGACDLHKFDSKKERDSFVEDHSDCKQISAKDAKKEHSEQFRYLNN